MHRVRFVSLSVAAATLAVTAFLAGPPGASAKGRAGPSSVPFVDINSAGPLTDVFLGNELSCQVAHTGDADWELYPPDVRPGDCGTFLVESSSDTLYAPDFNNHGGTATESLGEYTSFTTVSQTAVTGSGTASDPYKVVTVATGGNYTLTQTDTYVVGQESYTTTVSVKNNGASSHALILYRAGDCFLGGSDFGTGSTSNGAIACVQPESGRIEEWVPITGGSAYIETFYDTLWATIGSHAAFTNECDDCGGSTEDNSAGLSWSFTLAAGASQSFSQVTTFSPTGNQPLVTTKTADESVVAPGAQDGYTITITNPNQQDVTLDTITDTLPDGFTYVAGSTTGVTTSDPDISGQDLTWNGPFTDPASGEVTLHFEVTVSSENGDYLNNAGGSSAEFTVVPTGPTAQITVGTGADLAITKTDAPDPVLVGDLITYTLKATNNGPEDASNVVVTDALPSGVSFDSASSGCTESGGTVTCSIEAIQAGATSTFTVTVKATEVGSITNSASVSSDTEDPNPDNNTDSTTTTVNPVPSGGVQTGAGGTAGGSPALPVAAGLIALSLVALFVTRRRARG
jgi:uncharacterized repeat protein (TIGR01451 family)